MNVIALGAFLLLAVAPHVSLVADEEHGDVHVSYSGVRLAVMLESAGAPVGSKVKGAPARSYVVVSRIPKRPARHEQ